MSAPRLVLKHVDDLNAYIWTWTPKVEWTVPRDEVPLLLQGYGVSLQQWQATFDAVEDTLDTFLRASRTAFYLFFIPCLCAVYHISSSRHYWKELVKVAEEQNRIYRTMSVQVSAHLERVEFADGTIRNVPVGLAFDIVPPPNGTHAASLGAPMALGASNAPVATGTSMAPGASGAPASSAP